MKPLSWCHLFAAAVTAAALCLTVSGCGKSGGGDNARVTKENFEKIKEDMSEAAVVEILGPPTDTNNPPNQPDMKGLVWKNGNNMISLAFKDGKVKNKLSQFAK